MAVLLTGCGTPVSNPEGNLWRSATRPMAALPPLTTLPWFGEKLVVEDPSNIEYTAATCKIPKMPLQPTAEGKLTGTVFVLDPGHGGKDTGSYWVETLEDGRKVAFWESAYSYAMTGLLADKLRANGAMVYLTAYSELAQQGLTGDYGIDDPLPVPRDATFLWNQGSVVPKLGWWQRIHMGNDVYARLKKTHKVVFLSLHVDAMDSKGWKGSHVLVKDKKNPPKLAQFLAKEIKKGGFERTQYGQEKPLIDRTRDLFLFRKTENPDTLLWEMALPQNEEDSLRMRSREAREEYVDVALNAAVQYAESLQ
jgi:N-acetylmuramoyl-L-alanine amidase